jgi:hypothetical protein
MIHHLKCGARHALLRLCRGSRILYTILLWAP